MSYEADDGVRRRAPRARAPAAGVGRGAPGGGAGARGAGELRDRQAAPRAAPGVPGDRPLRQHRHRRAPRTAVVREAAAAPARAAEAIVALLLDTGVLYALADADDAWHARCKRLLEQRQESLLVPASVLPEVVYML